MLFVSLPLLIFLLHAGGYAEAKAGRLDPGAISVKSAHLCSTSADLRTHLEHFITAPKDLSEQELLLAKRQFLRRVQCSPPSTLDEVGSSASARAISREVNEDLQPDQVEQPRRLYMAIQLLKKELQKRQRARSDLQSCYCSLPTSLKHKSKVALGAWERWYPVPPPADLQGVPVRLLGRARTFRQEGPGGALASDDGGGMAALIQGLDGHAADVNKTASLAGDLQKPGMVRLQNGAATAGMGAVDRDPRNTSPEHGQPQPAASLVDTVADPPTQRSDIQLELDLSEDPHQAVLLPGARDAGWYGLSPRALFRKVVDANRWLANLTKQVGAPVPGHKGFISTEQGRLPIGLNGGRSLGVDGGGRSPDGGLTGHALPAGSMADGITGTGANDTVATLKPEPAGPGIIVVGSSGSLLLGRPPFGDRIDAFEDVIRFNGKLVAGRERHTGRKTTIEVVGGFGGTCGCPLGHCCDAHAAQQFWLRVGYPRLILKASPYGLNGAKEVWKRAPSVTQQARLFYPGDAETANAVINAWLRFMRAEKGAVQLRTRLPRVHSSPHQRGGQHHRHGREASTGLRMVIMLLMGGVRQPTIVGFDEGDSIRPHYFHGRGVARVRGKGAAPTADARIMEELVLAGLVEQLK